MAKGSRNLSTAVTLSDTVCATYSASQLETLKRRLLFSSGENGTTIAVILDLIGSFGCINMNVHKSELAAAFPGQMYYRD